MTDLRIIEESNALLAVMSAASAKLKEFHAEHDKNEEGFREKSRELQLAVFKAHSKWLKYAEQNFENWG